MSTGDAEEVSGTDRDPVRFDAGTPPLEWAMAGVGLVIVLVVLAGLVVTALTRGDEPPAFTASVVEVVPAGDGHLVLVEVRNTGGRAGAAVQVEGHVSGDPGSTVSAEIDYVTAGGTGTVGLVFDGSPAREQVEVGVVGWHEP
ncbi:hypothetical protein [Euzebya sp.]|uniref:hypothetical protein n=1 Tax=Euzebya sp. TaxID=1971409 RepID=UPI00351177DF